MMLIDSLKLIGYNGPPFDVDHAIHFLLLKLDSKACRMVCKGCWPIIEPQRDGRQFRLAATKVFLEWKDSKKLKSTVRKGILDEKWGTGRHLGELLYELVLMAMKKECACDDMANYETLLGEGSKLSLQTEFIKEQTSKFLDKHPVSDKAAPDAVSYEQLESINSLLFDPQLIPEYHPLVVARYPLDTLFSNYNSTLSQIPSIADPASFHNQALSLLEVVREKHKLLVMLHAELSKTDDDWRIENEHINLVT